ncbi:N-acetylglucosamine-6-phosphate deacetylase [Vibrio paucivorans]
MTLHAISAHRIFDGEVFHYQSALVWQGDTLIGIEKTDQLSADVTVTDYPDSTIVPGFIDLQVNGGGDIMFNSQTDVEAIDVICQAHRQHGTAYLLPTLISDTPAKITAALNATDAALNDRIAGVLGVHLEGPWLNPDKKGAHNADLFYDPSIDELEQFPWLSHGATLITLAPEKVNQGSIEWLANKGIILSCGHSNATSKQLPDETLQHIGGFTHLFNAMSPLESREPGVVGTALMTDHAWCSIITDDIHVAKQNVLLAKRSKPKDKLLIVTDAMATVGSKTNQFELNGETIRVVDNKLVNANGSLAGAHIGMDQSVAQAIEWGIDEAEAYRMASTYPAQALKQDNLGYLRTGFRAAATILSHDHQSQAVLVDGKLFSN